MPISETARNLIALLVSAGARLGKDLSQACDMPLGQYLATLVPSPLSSVNAHGRKLQEAMATHFRHYGSQGPVGWKEALKDTPVIQQADHSFLLLDRETFLNNYLFALAVDLVGGQKALTVQCSGVSCLSRRDPLRGSPFLNWNGGTYNIFGLSKNVYRKSSFITLPSPVTTVFEPLSPSSLPLTTDPFLGAFVGRSWDSAADAFQAMNAALWEMVGAGFVCDLAIVDDRLTSELIALHLEDETSPVHRLVFDGRVRDWFLRRKRELIDSPFNIGVNRPEPDHFWFRPDGSTRLCALVFQPGSTEPVYERGGIFHLLPWAIDPAAVIEAVRRGSLIPDIVLIYIARCLLSGVDAVGGASQQDYVELYQRLLLDCDAWAGLLTDEERAVAARRSPSRLGGAPLLGNSPVIHEILASMAPYDSLQSKFSPFLEMPLSDTIGELADASYLADRARQVIEST